MGLEVTAYTQVQLTQRGKRERAVFVVDEDSIIRWPLSSVGLKAGVYKSVGAEYQVRVGRLMSYMWFREQLAQLGGYRQHDVLAHTVTNGPFIELISFADLQGVIGNEAARKLAADFELHDHAAKALGADFYSLYVQFRRVFDFAKDEGVVSLH